jgi:hypothetical protein
MGYGGKVENSLFKWIILEKSMGYPMTSETK